MKNGFSASIFPPSSVGGKTCRLWAGGALWWTNQTTAGAIFPSFLLLPVQVALIIEVGEEDDEGDAVAKHHSVHGVGEVTVCEQVVARVQEEEEKLQLQKQEAQIRLSLLFFFIHCCVFPHQLQGRQVSFPPQVLLHVRPECCQAVVRIHDDVDEGVYQADEERCRTENG